MANALSWNPVRAYWDSALPLRFLGPTYIGIIADKLARWFVEEHYRRGGRTG